MGLHVRESFAYTTECPRHKMSTTKMSTFFGPLQKCPVLNVHLLNRPWPHMSVMKMSTQIQLDKLVSDLLRAVGERGDQF